MRSLVWAACCFFMVTSAFAKDDQEYKADPLAVKFGTLPDVSGMHLSPDGTKVSLLKWLASDIPAAVVFDLKAKKGMLVASSKKGEAKIQWCDWATNERLLCGYRTVNNFFGAGGYLPMTRLVGVNADGTDLKVLVDRKLADEFSQYQDRVIDWLPDDPDDVLIQVPSTYGSAAGRLNIHTGYTANDISTRERTYDWMADGHGNVRLYFNIVRDTGKWYVRRTKDADWTVLYESKLSDLKDHFQPAGFGANENELLYFDSKDGHLALWAEDLSTGEKPRLIFSDPTVDIGGLLTLGKYQRLVAVQYNTDHPQWRFFDKQVAQIHDRVASMFPGLSVGVVDESWDGRYYLLAVRGAQDPGSLYRLDTEQNQLQKLALAYPKLTGMEMAPVKPVTFKARDGVEIPGYLTLPHDAGKGPLPTVLFPHGGPQSRDIWSFDPIVQFLAASGYAVLQVNYRGSGGYGDEWVGSGGIQNWRQAIEDLTDGVKSLVDNGTSDPNRLCVVGWSYGGYAALMSVIENPDMYKCAVSIAGVTDPKAILNDKSRFVGYSAVKAFFGDNEDILEQGSPQKRAEEIKVPVLLFQGERDINVPADQGKDMAAKLDQAHKSYQYIVYDDVEHDIERSQYRIDMLSRIGEFLDSYIGAAGEVSAKSAASEN